MPLNNSFRTPNVTESIYQPPPTISATVDIKNLLMMVYQQMASQGLFNSQIDYGPGDDADRQQPLPNVAPSPAGPSAQFGMQGDPMRIYRALSSILQPYMNMPSPGTR